MKETAFNALVSVETVAAALLLANGTNFLFNETTIHGNGTMAGYGNQSSNQQKVTQLRHKLHYYRRDTSLDAGYSQVFDILESDTLAQQSKSTTRPGVTRVATRDDDDRLRYKESDYS
jgi:hypothetical protein